MADQTTITVGDARLAVRRALGPPLQRLGFRENGCHGCVAGFARGPVGFEIRWDRFGSIDIIISAGRVRRVLVCWQALMDEIDPMPEGRGPTLFMTTPEVVDGALETLRASLEGALGKFLAQSDTDVASGLRRIRDRSSCL